MTPPSGLTMPTPSRTTNPWSSPSSPTTPTSTATRYGSRELVAELGTVTILDHRSLSYDPTSGKAGTDTITYTVVDGDGGSTTSRPPS